MDARVAAGRRLYEDWAIILTAVLQSIVVNSTKALVQVDHDARPPRFQIHVDPADMGRAIGRHNHTIDALTTLTKSWSFLVNLPCRIEIPGATTIMPGIYGRWSDTDHAAKEDRS